MPVTSKIFNLSSENHNDNKEQEYRVSLAIDRQNGLICAFQ